MAFIDWNSNLSVNIEEIDSQHKNLIKVINELHEAMKNGKGKDILGKIVNSLIDYTTTHFNTEENYFIKFGYPETGTHKKEHSAFVQKAAQFKEGFEKKEMALTIEVMNFLSDWLKNHIMGTDKKYSQFFIKHGLK